jgi:hypothetical protein
MIFEDVQEAPAPDPSRLRLKSALIGFGALAVFTILAWLISVMPKAEDKAEITAQIIPNVEQTRIKIEQKAVAKQARHASTSSAAAPVANMIRSMTDARITTPEAYRFSDGVTGLGEGGFGNGVGFGDGAGFNPGAMAGSMRARCNAADRINRLRRSGAGPQTEVAVVNALRYFAERQMEDGSFTYEYPVSMTGLVLLAYLGHCETPSSPEFGKVVTKAALYLMEAAKNSEGGALYSQNGGKPAYENAIATYALCELYSLARGDGSASRVPGLETALRQGVDAIVGGQDSTGGWNYGYRKGTGGDTSVAGWNFQALKAAYNTGMNISGVNEALDHGLKFFKFAQADDGGFAYRPQSNLQTKPTLVGIGALAFVLWDNNEDGVRDLAFDWLNKNEVEVAPMRIYSWYYVTQAYFMIGGEPWSKWNSWAMPQILGSQGPDGAFHTSVGHGPRDLVYATALCTLSLEVYYRYLPTSDKVGR